MDKNSPQSSMEQRRLGIGPMLLLLTAVLAVLFLGALLPGHTLFSNDGPLGALISQGHRLPSWFSGGWGDLNTLGVREGGAWPNVTYGLQWLLGPVLFSKTYAPITLAILGLGAWTFFRQSGLPQIACLLGSLAVTLNSTFFSVACWGIAAHPLTIGMAFFAMALLANPTSRRHWLRLAVAGFAVGMGVVEGADVGAIFSILVALFALYQAWITDGPRGKNLILGASRILLVAAIAAFFAAQAISTLVSTQIQGVAGAQQENRTKQERWDWATQWSLPKSEALGIIVPGLFGYRMDSPDGSNYWGAAGRDPAWYRYFESGKQGPSPSGFLRFSGGGNYAGVLVVLVAFWAALQGFRRKDSVFSLETRRWIWFWAALAVISLLLAFGRFAPFYQILYALPYFSTIRNPAKFVHVFNWALVVLFAYGISGLWQRYMVPASAYASLKTWWERVRGFDRRWVVGCMVFLGVSVVAWLMYASNRTGFQQSLQEVGFEAGMAEAISGFSIRQVGIFILLFAVAAGLVILVISGRFSGPKAKLGAILLGSFMVLDLGRANLPWIVVWDYQKKYASNPVIDFLRQEPYKGRVAIMPEWMLRAAQASPQLSLLDQIYRIEWAQHVFLYYNVQSLDIVQMPRMPEDLLAFETTLQPKSMAEVQTLVARRWQLTNTRYLLGPAQFLDVLNQQIDAGKGRFRTAMQFNLAAKPGVDRPTGGEDITAVPATNGMFALFEFTGALPRVSLYSNWQVVTNDTVALKQLADPAFDPARTVLVANPIPEPKAAEGTTNQSAGSVEFASYAPKHITFKADAKTPAVLLLNDRYDPNWQVLVDGKKAPLLRCNYLMRGVQLSPGTHTVEFHFRPPMGAFYVSLAAAGVGLVLCLVLLFLKETPEQDPKVIEAAAKNRKPAANG